MAELTLKTRLLNKMSADHVDGLLKGEINFYPAGDYLVMEVGGAEKPFAALASDVAAWAKAEEKPKYKAGEIEGLADYISGEIEDTNTKYSFEEKNGQLVISYKDVKDEEYKLLTAIDIITETELNTKLASYVTRTKLVEELSKYVLKDDFDLSPYATIEYVDGEIDKVETALAGVKTTADKAAVKTEVEAALAGKVDVVEGKSLVADTEIARLATLVNYDDTDIKADIKANADAIDAIEADYLKAADKTELTNAINTAEEQALADAKAYADGLISGADLDQYTTEAEVKSIVDNVIASAADSDTYNSLTKLVDYIDAHGGEAADMAEAIETLEGKVDVEKVSTAIATAKAEAATDAQSKADAALEAAKADATEKADAAEAAAKAEAEAKANAALDAAKADATEKADAALEAAKAYADDLNHEDTTYTAGTGLKLDGTVFSIDTDLVFILDANA